MATRTAAMKSASATMDDVTVAMKGAPPAAKRGASLAAMKGAPLAAMRGGLVAMRGVAATMEDVTVAMGDVTAAMKGTSAAMKGVTAAMKDTPVEMKGVMAALKGAPAVTVAAAAHHSDVTTGSGHHAVGGTMTTATRLDMTAFAHPAIAALRLFVALEVRHVRDLRWARMTLV